MGAKNLVDKVEGLFSLPEVCRQFNQLLDNECTDTELAELIGYDSVLSAKLFGLANDPRKFDRPADTISEAISRLGTDRLRGIMASTTATNVFANMASDIVDMDNYWHHSVCCALACESLARQAGLETPQRLFVAGLMHDIGQLVIYQVIPDLAIKVLKKAGEQESYRYRMEREIIGITHAEVGQELLSRWQLPLLIQKVVEFHHEPALAGEYTMEASIAHIATAVANCVEPSWKMGGEEHDAARQITPFAWRTTGLSSAVIDETVSEISIESVNVLSAIDPESVMIF
jgi:putative nucleotidyltransferase with HDIG domain